MTIKLTKRKIQLISLISICLLCSLSIFIMNKINIFKTNTASALGAEPIYYDDITSTNYYATDAAFSWDISQDEDGSVKAYLYADGTLILHDETPNDDTNLMMSFNKTMVENNKFGSSIKYHTGDFENNKQASHSDDFRNVIVDDKSYQVPPWLYEQFMGDKIKIKKVRIANKINVRDTSFLFASLLYAEDIIIENLNFILYDNQNIDQYNSEEYMLFRLGLESTNDVLIKFKEDFIFNNFTRLFNDYCSKNLIIDMSELSEDNFDFVNYELSYKPDGSLIRDDISYCYMYLSMSNIKKLYVPKSMNVNNMSKLDISSSFFTDGGTNVWPKSFEAYNMSDEFMYYTTELKTKEDGVSYMLVDELHTLYSGYNLFVSTIQDGFYDIDNEFLMSAPLDTCAISGIEYFIKRDGHYVNCQTLKDIYDELDSLTLYDDYFANFSTYLYQYVYERRLEEGKSTYISLDTYDPDGTLNPELAEFDEYADKLFKMYFDLDIKNLTSGDINYLDEINVAIFDGDKKLDYKVFKNAFRICSEKRTKTEIQYENLDSNSLWTFDDTSDPDYYLLQTVIDTSNTNLDYDINDIKVYMKQNVYVDAYIKLEMIEPSTRDADYISYWCEDIYERELYLKDKTIIDDDFMIGNNYFTDEYYYDYFQLYPCFATGKWKVTLYYPKYYTDIERKFAKEKASGKVEIDKNMVEDMMGMNFQDFLDDYVEWYKIVDDYLILKIQFDKVYAIPYHNADGDITIPVYYSGNGVILTDYVKAYMYYIDDDVAFTSEGKTINKDDINTIDDIKNTFEKGEITLMNYSNLYAVYIMHKAFSDVGTDPDAYSAYETDPDAYLANYDIDSTYIAIPLENCDIEYERDMKGCDFHFIVNSSGNLEYTLVPYFFENNAFTPEYGTTYITVNPLDVSESNKKMNLFNDDGIIRLFYTNNKGNKIEVPSSDYELIYNDDKTKVTINPLTTNITGTREVIVNTIKPKDDDPSGGDDKPDKPDKPKEDPKPSSITTATITVGGTSDAMNGYIDGYKDDTLRPNNSITRAEFAKIVASLQSGFSDKDVTNLNSTNHYNDVKADDWYAPYIGYLTKCKVIAGYNDNTFRPNEKITRAEVSKILSNMYNIDEKDISNIFDNELEGHWYKEVVTKLVKGGLLKGYPDGTIKANNTITRAETITLINRVRGISNKQITDSEKLLVKNKYKDVPANEWYFNDICIALFN